MTEMLAQIPNAYHVLILIDVTEQGRAEQALRAAVGIALCCHTLRVVITPNAWLHCLSAFGQRCIATLQGFDHAVRILSARDAAFLRRRPGRIEVWR
jgi:hypothetical protein